MHCLRKLALNSLQTRLTSRLGLEDQNRFNYLEVRDQTTLKGRK